MIWQYQDMSIKYQDYISCELSGVLTCLMTIQLVNNSLIRLLNGLTSWQLSYSTS